MAKKVAKASKKKKEVKKAAKKPKKASEKSQKALIQKAPKNQQHIEEVINELVGEDVVPLVRVMQKKPSISEFSLADAIKSEINLTRNMLYRLYNNNLVSFVRRKDKKKGWYIYYWTFDPKNIPYLSQQLKRQKVERLSERLEREKKTQFYLCSNACIRLDFEQATDFEFRCPECSELLDLQDNTAKIKELEDEIKSLQSSLQEKKK